MTDEEMVEMVYRQKGIPIPNGSKLEIVSTNKTEKKGIKMYTDLSILDEKKVSSLKENIQMTIVNGKIAVLNTVTFELVDSEDEVSESSFFASVDSKPSTTKCALMLIKEDGKEVYQDPTSEWLVGVGTMNFEIYPSEMIPIMSKSTKENFGIVNKMEKDGSAEFFDASTFVERITSFDQAVKNTDKAFDELSKEIKRLKATSGSVNIDEFLERYYFRKHLLIEGEKGGGKTYSVDKKLRDEGVDTEIVIGHEGIEAIDLLGYYVKTETGDLVWLDGALTKAFRKATKGKVGLFIDEMLRIPKRELNILVGSLTPSSVGTYRLRTNRIVNISDGIGETEVLEIPMSNLWAVGTTNVGAGYEVDEIDDALADRFRRVNKTTSNSELESILNSYIDEKKMTKSIVPKLVEFYNQMRDLYKAGEIEKVVNTRHLCEVIQLSDSESEIKMYMFDLIPTWSSSDTDGQPNKADSDIIGKLIKKIIK